MNTNSLESPKTGSSRREEALTLKAECRMPNAETGNEETSASKRPIIRLKRRERTRVARALLKFVSLLSPHPGPLPWGEGEYAALSWNVESEKPLVAIQPPTPQGRGIEGERNGRQLTSETPRSRRSTSGFRPSACCLLLKSLLTSAATIVLLAGCSPSSTESTASKDPSAYPNKTITLICPWSPGGGTDRMSRMMARELKEELGQPVVVVNKTGGGGSIGHSEGANAKPDGYTLTMTTFELSTMHWMGISDLTWENFQPLYLLNGDAAAFIVKEDSDIKSLDDLIARIKEKPKTIKMSGTASGGAWDLARAGFLMKAGLPVDSVIWVPTQGSAPAIVELLGGHIDIICCSLPEAAAQLESEKLRALAVMAPERAPGFPEVPTVKELGIDWEAVGWRGLCVPKGTPEEAMKVLTETCDKLVSSVPFMKFMAQNRFATLKGDPANFGEFLKEQDAQWKSVIEATGFAAQ